MPQFIRRTMNWGELPGEPLLSFDLNIALVPDEPDTDTTERFRLEAVRIARAFLLEQDVEKARRLQRRKAPLMLSAAPVHTVAQGIVK